MKLPKHVISIYRKSTGEHIIEEYCAESPVIAAYLVAMNELVIPFDVDEDRSDYEWDEVVDEFKDYGYSIVAITLR